MFSFSNFKTEYCNKLGNDTLFAKLDYALDMLSVNTTMPYSHYCDISDFGRQNMSQEKKNEIETNFQKIWESQVKVMLNNQDFSPNWTVDEICQFHHYVQQARGFVSFCNTVLFIYFFYFFFFSFFFDQYIF